MIYVETMGDGPREYLAGRLEADAVADAVAGADADADAGG